MAQTRPGVYFCQQAARRVSPVPGGDGGRHRFMVGTCSLQRKNEVHLVEFSEETAEVVLQQVLPHADEMWQLSVSPTDARRVLTYASGKAGGPGALRLWRAGDRGAQEGRLELLSSLQQDDTEAPLGPVKSLLWDPHHEGNVLVAGAETVQVFQCTQGKMTRVSALQAEPGRGHELTRCHAACLDPHHPQQVSTVDDTHLKTWDLRSSRLAFRRDNAHLFGARDVDYNPNVPYQVLTAGEDAVLRFWDLRNSSKCLLALSGGHHHWIVHARYNHHHDQLVLSCGADSAVCLWRAGSVASQPLGSSCAAGEDGASRPPDGLIQRFEEHEDSIYSCCWSATDAWAFASVSYDGKLVVNRVPGEEKYRILL
ncbi:unnamed protein product [Prorocentrum cordatum]|uniref:EIPR1-like beta-propeller domain-containing protein n=1 Tax=Prorocentrum cordatum TaxID=2364126 RepID=A0ABN9PIW2_9DINO|nr:unnamed protein product [Polarella glacialis]